MVTTHFDIPGGTTDIEQDTQTGNSICLWGSTWKVLKATSFSLAAYFASVSCILLMVLGGNSAYVALASFGAEGTMLAPISNAYLVVPVVVGVALGDEVSVAESVGMAAILVGVPILSLNM